MSSLQDVARLAGVSTTLVSRTINNQSGVSEKSRQKILAAMKELRYEPNALARSLVTRKTNTIGIVMDSLCEPFFFPLIEGMEEAAANTHYDLIYSSGRNSSTHKQNAARYFSQGRADGIIVYGSQLDDEPVIRFLANQSLPFVVVENTFPALPMNNIALDNAFGSGLAVDHLISCGCRTICHVGGNMNYRVSIDRQTGYIQAMQRHGIIVDSRMLIQAGFDVRESCEAIRQYLARTAAEDLPDAFYCGSDNTAYGTIIALEESGIHVPEQVMVVGFDNDLPPRDYRYKPLTTVSQPLRQMGRSAMEVLIEQIRDPEKPCQQISYYPELLVRETTLPKAARNVSKRGK